MPGCVLSIEDTKINQAKLLLFGVYILMRGDRQ